MLQNSEKNEFVFFVYAEIMLTSVEFHKQRRL